MGTYGAELDTSAPAERLWQLWSDVSTWKDWNPNVTSMTLRGPFATGSTAIMKTPAGREHEMRIVDVQPPRTFALRTKVIPGTNFTFRCAVETRGSGNSRISQNVTIGGPLGGIVGPMAGKRVAADFAAVLEGLAAAAGDSSAAGGAR